MRRQSGAVALLGTAVAVLSLAACGGSSGTSPSNNVSFKSLSSQQQTAFENEAVAEVEANLLSFTSFDSFDALGFQKVVAHRGNAMFQVLGKKAHAPRFQSNQSCATENPANPTYNSFGIPDTLTITLNCNETVDGVTDVATGTVAYGDPNPSNPGLNYDLGYNLTLAETGSTDGDLNLTLQGTTDVTESGNTLTAAATAALNASITNSSTDNGTFKLNASDNATYAANSALPTYFGQSLPAGTFNISGNWSYDVTSTNLNANFSFSVSTPNGGLSIDPTCVNNPSNVVSGEADIKFSDGTLVKVQWSQCPASPTITVS